MKSRGVALAAAIAGASAPIACGTGGAGGSAGAVVDSAGVTIVTNAAVGDSPATLTARTDFRLGGRETPEEAFYRLGRRSVDTDGSGRLVVLDLDAKVVQVFDSAGKHVRTMGRAGQGPGELSLPFALTVTPDGHVYVADIGNRVVVHWGPNGSLLEPMRLPRGYAGEEIAWTPDGMVTGRRDLTELRLELVPPEGDPTELVVIPRGETRNVFLPSCNMGMNGMGPVFAPNIRWTAAGTRVFVASGHEYVIDVYDSGRRVRSIRRDLPARPATPELAEASLGEGLTIFVNGRELTCDPAEVVEQQGVAPFIPHIGVLAVAPDGTLWVRRYSIVEASASIDLFDAEGLYLGTLPPDAPFPVAFLPDGRMVYVERDDLDVQRAVVARVELSLP